MILATHSAVGLHILQTQMTRRLEATIDMLSLSAIRHSFLLHQREGNSDTKSVGERGWSP